MLRRLDRLPLVLSAIQRLSFKPFDLYILHVTVSWPSWVCSAAFCGVTVLWAIFVRGLSSLGFKASNLTNRGIVRTGSYRYVRHPAHGAKLMIWILQGVIFGQFCLLILFGFILIYGLRAWTKERHLSHDGDYLAYKQSVRWRFIPGIV